MGRPVGPSSKNRGSQSHCQPSREVMTDECVRSGCQAFRRLEAIIANKCGSINDYNSSYTSIFSINFVEILLFTLINYISLKF
uniref:Uncharacterized protein n=1 Tax=Lepeophtheirus salmonis TaxID=72036 RepID=A0A0K2T5N1_LEPSM